MSCPDTSEFSFHKHEGLYGRGDANPSDGDPCTLDTSNIRLHVDEQAR